MIIVNKKFRMRILMFFFLLCCLQNLSLISLGSVAIKYYHIFAILCFPLLLSRKGIFIPPRIILLFIGLVIVSSFWGVFIGFGFNSFIINYLFAFYSLILVMTIGNDFTRLEWIEIVKKVFIFMMLLIWIKNLVQIRYIISFLKNPYGHPLLTYIFGGGANLEATFMAMATPFFYKDKKFWLYMGLSVLLSVIYASRTAAVVNVLCIAWVGLVYLDKKAWTKIFAAFILGIVGITYLYSKGTFNYIISRFSTIGSEPGSIGRLNMWMYFLEIVKEYPLGCGIGNSIDALRKVSGASFWENNFHNIYLQMFIDLGLIGGSLYLFTTILFVFNNIKNISKEPIIMVLLLYIITSLLQFRGAEAIIYCFLGIYLQQLRVSKTNLLMDKG